MKKLLLLLFAVSLITVVNASGISGPGTGGTNSSNRFMTLEEFVKLKPREYEKLTGKKLKFKEKLGLKIFQWKVKRKMAGEATPQQLKQGRLSLIFGALALVCLFIPVGVVAVIGLGLAIAGFVLGLKSIKGNSNTMGILGLIFSSLFLVLVIIAVAVVASWGWY